MAKPRSLHQYKTENFGYRLFSIIQLRTDVGIIAAIEDHKFLVMFKTINNGVEFKWYPTSMIAKYRVIG